MENKQAIYQPPDTQAQLSKFVPTDAAIADLATKYLPLKIADVNDLAGYGLVHKARMDVKGKRCEVEKVRKELKADALEYGRKVDSEAKRITALLEPIESHLVSEEEKFEAAKEAIANAARLKREAEAKAIADAEAARLKAEHDAEVERMRVENERLASERQAIEAERAKAAAEQKAAQDKLEAERAKIVAEQKAVQDKIDAERRAVEAEKTRLAEIEAARLREIETQRREKEAAERAKIETEERLAREAAAEKARIEGAEAAAKAKAEADELARIKAEKLRPDRDKLLSVAAAVGEIEIPEVSEVASEAASRVRLALSEAKRKIRSIAEELGVV
jgi:hypothetical protein